MHNNDLIERAAFCSHAHGHHRQDHDLFEFHEGGLEKEGFSKLNLRKVREGARGGGGGTNIEGLRRGLKEGLRREASQRKPQGKLRKELEGGLEKGLQAGFKGGLRRGFKGTLRRKAVQEVYEGKFSNGTFFRFKK